jgi:diguanylate cyclase
LALSHKIGRERQEKLGAQNRLLEIQLRTNEDLEDQVKERTLKLEQAIVRLESSHRDLSEMSIIDPLTRVHNRRYFDQLLAVECRRAMRISHPLALLMVDIDHFKAINDVHGHLIGDQCLRLVAQTIRENVIRGSDLVARYGGEEFAQVLSATTPDNAVVVAERIRGEVEKIDFIHQGQPIELRVSIGVAGWVPLKETSVRQLIQVADDALYVAKNNGRNRVEAAVVAGEEIETTSINNLGFRAFQP